MSRYTIIVCSFGIAHVMTRQSVYHEPRQLRSSYRDSAIVSAFELCARWQPRKVGQGYSFAGQHLIFINIERITSFIPHYDSNVSVWVRLLFIHLKGLSGFRLYGF
jgi:hypothetical protein